MLSINPVVNSLFQEPEILFPAHSLDRKKVPEGVVEIVPGYREKPMPPYDHTSTVPHGRRKCIAQTMRTGSDFTRYDGDITNEAFFGAANMA